MDVPSDLRSPLLARVAAHAAADPAAPAVTDARGALTRGELSQRAGDLAARLRASGVEAGDRVAVVLPRSADLVVAVLAVAVAGAVAVRLDPAAPAERLRWMVADAGARAVLAGPALPAGAVDAGVPVLDAADPPPADQPQATTLASDPSDLAYVVYTSGSTGSPKGVAVGQAGLDNLVAWHQRAFALTAADRTALVASPGFDASTWELWPALAAGAGLHVAPDGVLGDPWALRDWLVASGITVTFLPTPLAEAVLDLEWPADAALRVLLTGGDRLTRRPRAGLPFTLVNNYGVSEATVVSTSGVVAPADESDAGAPPVGAAIDGVELAVIDPAAGGGELRPLPAGEVGELLVRGVSVAHGYTGAGAPPADAPGPFVADPAHPGARAYRTGDLVRARADGQLEYVGRVDDQVQVRGVRVEPAEVTAALLAHAAVAAAACVADSAVPDSAAGPGAGASAVRLVAAVVLREGADPAAVDLDAHLAALLPPAMRPAVLLRLPELPLTLAGKVDRDELRELARERSVVAGGVDGAEHAGVAPDAPAPPAAAPRSPLEAVVADLVAGKLGLDEVGVDDDFFTLGGHSLLGAELIMLISRDLGVELPLRAVFEAPTVAGLAAAVEAALAEQIEALDDEAVLAAAALVEAGPRAEPEPRATGDGLAR